MIVELGTIVQGACLDFLLALGRLTHTTYRDTNAFLILLFFLLWPAVTLLLVAIVLWQAWQLRRSE